MTTAYTAALAAINALSINRLASHDHAERLIREDVRDILNAYRAAVEAPCSHIRGNGTTHWCALAEAPCPHRREVGSVTWCELGEAPEDYMREASE